MTTNIDRVEHQVSTVRERGYCLETELEFPAPRSEFGTAKANSVTAWTVLALE